MTRAAALHQFFNGLGGLDAYVNTSVPKEANLPYMTYEYVLGGFEDTYQPTVQLWDHTDSEASLNAIGEKIYDAIGRGGQIVHYDDGAMWIKRGTPFMQSMQNEADPAIKRRILAIEIEFLND